MICENSWNLATLNPRRTYADLTSFRENCQASGYCAQNYYRAISSFICYYSLSRLAFSRKILDLTYILEADRHVLRKIRPWCPSKDMTAKDVDKGIYTFKRILDFILSSFQIVVGFQALSKSTRN